MQTFVRIVTFISCTFFAVLFYSFFFKNTSGKAKETGEVAKGFVRNTFRLFKREVVYYISERGGFGGGRQIFGNVQNVRGLLNQIKIEANSRFLQQQTKKIALVWFFLATNGRPRARPLQFCCVHSFNLCTTHSSDNKISILLRHLLKKRLILFLLYFFSNCTPFFMLLRVERRALPSHMPLCYIQQPPWSSMVKRRVKEEIYIRIHTRTKLTGTVEQNFQQKAWMPTRNWPVTICGPLSRKLRIDQCGRSEQLYRDEFLQPLVRGLPAIYVSLQQRPILRSLSNQ